MFTQVYTPIAKITENQIKKHFTQMTKNEIEFLKMKINRIKNYITVSTHLTNKCNKINILTCNDILNNDYEIIEYNETANYNGIDKRVLIRSINSFDTIFIDTITNIKTIEKCNICFVVSIVTGIIVTGYFNKCNDFHNTINFNRYNKNIVIIK
jgi:hypothetical protein